jgi:hypothetical protein
MADRESAPDVRSNNCVRFTSAQSLSHLSGFISVIRGIVYLLLTFVRNAIFAPQISAAFCFTHSTEVGNGWVLGGQSTAQVRISGEKHEASIL